MDSLLSITPFIRVAHHYRFPLDNQPSELGRIGYCYAFHLVDGGRGTLRIHSQRYYVKKGDLLFIPPACEHSFESGPSQALTTYNVYCELWSDPPLNTEAHLVWKSSQFNPSLLTKIHPETDLNRIPAVFPLHRYTELTEMIASIVKQFQKRNHRSVAAAHLLLKAFILCLGQAINDNHADPRILKIIDLIERGEYTESSYEEWLRQSGLKKTHFHQLFKAGTGLSPKAFWKRTIMKRAASALLESNQTVTTLANDLGFSSIHHFTKQFTAFHGVSPTAFRNRTLNGLDGRGAESNEK
ncbi:AraC-like DNA-binding protein [Paenibacillus rhizosphaerae]|uniref:AraC-like DNA-binding protein n=1 Tax=Paenibacillus rhizosphaerae TaxID=297318 RepID=A0A839TF64_9BACL|nr:AraC family transcriptional regulator [Paenibacillus rhizosphaerae]MBB3125435.1 AraC-like DNA-binding protein [Paenibacillus rhizosphaerae]